MSTTDTLSMEMMLYEPFYRKYGLRTAGRITNPVVSPMTEWDMTRDSILHYIPTHEKDYGIADNYPLLKGWNKPTYVYHIEKMTKDLGSPKNKIFNMRLAIRAFRKAYPKLKWLKDERQLELQNRNPQSLLIMNYGLADKSVRYRPIPMIEVFKYQNMRHTVWSQVARLAESSSRHQYIEMHVPTNLPTKMMLDRATPELKRVWMKDFPSDDHLDFLELWRWMNPSYRKQSFLGLVNEKHIGKINLILRAGNNFILVNLGKLHNWVSGIDIEDLEADTEDEQEEEGTNYIRMQKRVLKMFLILSEMRDPNKVETIVSDANKNIEYHVENDIEVQVDEENDEENQEKQDLIKVEEPEAAEGVDTISTVAKVENEDVIVEKDQETGKVTVTYKEPFVRREIALRKNKLLETIEGSSNKLKQELKGNLGIHHVLKDVVKEEIDQKVDQPIVQQSKMEIKLVSNIVAQAIELNRGGALTSGEVKRLEAMANRFKTIKDPYGTGKSLKEVIEDPIPEALESPVTRISDNPLVIDKSMLETTIVEFDKRYIKKTLKRDTMRSAIAVQKAGLAVTSYEVTELKDVANEFERHSLQVTPVGGATSTVHIKIPKVREDGTMLVGGTSYRLRKQRVDQ